MTADIFCIMKWEIAVTKRTCGNCRYWHKWTKEQIDKYWGDDLHKWKLYFGSCDKIPEGTEFEGNKFDGIPFEDECYDECFNCWEEKI